MVAMADPTERPGEVASISERLIVLCVLSPHKDLAISTNLGGHIGFGLTGLLRGVDTHCVKIFGMPVCLPGVGGTEAVVTEMTRCLLHPRRVGLEMNPGDRLSSTFCSFPSWIPELPLPPWLGLMKGLS